MFWFVKDDAAGAPGCALPGWFRRRDLRGVDGFMLASKSRIERDLLATKRHQTKSWSPVQQQTSMAPSDSHCRWKLRETQTGT